MVPTPFHVFRGYILDPEADSKRERLWNCTEPIFPAYCEQYPDIVLTSPAFLLDPF